jgi:Zn-dependent oligopeptidase
MNSFTEDVVSCAKIYLFYGLTATAKPKQAEEFEELKTYAASKGFEGLLHPWDVDYWRRRQRVELFG